MVHAARLTNFAGRFIHKTGLLKKKNTKLLGNKSG